MKKREMSLVVLAWVPVLAMAGAVKELPEHPATCEMAKDIPENRLTPDDAATTNAPVEKRSMKEMMTDSKDGKLDLSEWLGTAKGVLPMPIVITEPAVGAGLGLSLMFFHGSIQERMEAAKKKNPDGTAKRLAPPSISGLAGFGTENGTWGAGAFHMGIWKDDTIRYVGALGYASVNYDLYGPLNRPTPVTVEGAVLLQQLTFRLGDSDFFAGMNYKRISSTAKANFGREMPAFVEEGREVQSGGASGILEYDSRDNIFTPNRGLSSKAEWTHYDTWLGSDKPFDQVAVKNRYWFPLSTSVVLGVRGDLFSSYGNVPFYMLPYVDLRGIPAMRYQGEHVLTTEMELRWDVTPRWSVVGFAGAGWTGQKDFEELGSSDTYPSGGFGFRYLVARLFNLRTGIDIGFSEEGQSVYFTTGTAWGR